MSDSHHQDLLALARAGDQEALGKLLKGHDRTLQQMARNELGGQLQARLSAADIVQQTCLSAIRNFNDFQGENELQFAAWLRGIHERNVKDIVRKHVVARKRAVSAQQILDKDTLDHRSTHTPSQHVMLDESTVRILKALDSVPETQAQAVRLRHLEQLSLAEIAQRMNRTEVAVASLLKRGLTALRTQLPNDAEEF